MTYTEVFRIINPGVFSSIQDVGRSGFRKFAIPQSGCLDSKGYRMANYQAGNQPADPTIEIVGGPFTFEALSDCIVALAGLDLEVSVNDSSTAVSGPIPLRKQDQVVVTGKLIYLSTHGELVAFRHFGSCATYPPAKLGGLDGKGLQKGDVIRVRRTGRTSE